MPKRSSGAAESVISVSREESCASTTSVVHDQDQILEEGGQARAHDAFDLVGILHHSRDDLTGAGAFQPIQIEPKQVLEQRGAEIPYQTLLGAHAQLTREVCEAVLGEQRRPQQRNQPHRDAGG